jgi:acyl carrier protein
MTDVERKILAFVLERTKLSEIDVEAELRDYIDSVDMIDLLAFLETTFAIRIDDEEVTPEVFSSLATAARFVQEKLAS